MKRCPMCNCGAEFTNKTEYYAYHAGGAILAIGAGIGVGVLHPGPGHAGHAAHAVHHNVTQNVKKHFKCTNPRCNYEWDE